MSNDNDPGSPAASDTNGNIPPSAPPPPETREETINKWLSSRYIEHSYLGDPLVLSIKDFINIIATSSTHPGKSWLEDNALGLAAVLLTMNRTDILIVSSNAATKLASVGLCISDRNEFMTHELSSQCYDAMREESIRWVVVPVTNGMASQEEATRVKAARAEAAKARKSREAGKEDDSETVDQSLLDMITGGGTHWGLMIIDKQRNDARWLDGHSTLKKKSNKKWCIKEILPAAWTAGKILCGYDKVMDLERGQFTAATLKHVPHDTDDNSYKGDKNSACGPWVFAMLEYILKNPNFLTNGLYGAFRLREKEDHQQKMAFNSLETRKRMQEIIRSVADRNLGEDKLPYQMTARILEILDCPSTADLLNGILRFGRKKPPPRSGGDGGPNKGPDGDDDNEDDNGDEDDNNAFLQELLERQFYMNKDSSAQGFYDTSETGNLTVPDGLTMPEDFADSNEVDKAAFEQWKEANEELLEYVIPRNKRAQANDMSFRAALHASSGRGFEKESDDRLRNLWRNDSCAVNQTTKTLFQPEEIRKLMEKAYGIWRTPEDKRKTSEGKGQKPPEDSNKTTAGQPTIVGGVFRKPKAPGKTRKLTYPPGSGSDQLPQFATLKVPSLDKWVATNADLFTGKDLSELARVTQRAVLHRTYRGSFSNETSKDLRDTWYNDPHAFTESEREENWPPEDIAQRMDNIYVSLEPPLFISLNHADIDTWVQNLPPDVRDRMTDAKGNLLYNYAPGTLHRLFVGEFEELREEGEQNSEANIKLLADWRKEDKIKYSSGAQAVNGLVAKFGKDDGGTRDLAFLAKSPLHWPSREYLLNRIHGQKRKRTGPDSEGGATKTSNEEGRSSGSPTKKRKCSPPNFLAMKDAELHLWLESVPDDKKAKLVDSENKIKNQKLARIYFERVFNNTFQKWAAEEPLSDESKVEINKWRNMVVHGDDIAGGLYRNTDASLRMFLNSRLYPKETDDGKNTGKKRKAEHDFPDYSQDEGKWPEYWKRQKG